MVRRKIAKIIPTVFVFIATSQESLIESVKDGYFPSSGVIGVILVDIVRAAASRMLLAGEASVSRPWRGNAYRPPWRWR